MRSLLLAVIQTLEANIGNRKVFVIQFFLFALFADPAQLDMSFSWNVDGPLTRAVSYEVGWVRRKYKGKYRGSEWKKSLLIFQVLHLFFYMHR